MSGIAHLPDPVTRRFITASVLAATLMNSLDLTIANVALPHMQGSVSASSDQITWVLTSYIVAAAIFTPMTGWLGSRFGRRRLMLVSVMGFTVASMLCGVAHTIGELVLFRMLQGLFGAALVPMSQAILLDINPPERHGHAMAIWTMGAIMAPILGPVLGGWLTDNFTWRWVFFINLPVGILAFIGLSIFLPGMKEENPVRLDIFGFATLGIAVGALQLMLDRGQQLDWFSSLEICIEGAAFLFFLYLFIVQTLTARRPFIDLALFADRNFLACSILGFLVGVLVFSVLALLPQILEGLMGYPVVTTGLVMAPRGVGTLLAVIFVSRFAKRFDGRLLILVGLCCNAVSMFMMSRVWLGMDSGIIITSGLVQGVGTGLIFVPLTTLAFATLPPRFRNEGAAMFTLIRNLGSSIGISALQVLSYRNAEKVHGRLVEGLRPDNPVVATMPHQFSLTEPSGIAALAGEVQRQAMMVSMVDNFWLLSVVTILAAFLLLFMKSPRKGAEAVALHLE
ncbi:MAG TPA: DHA2 family efflux MFS transporter permease subunit [Sphingomonadaceae bacterium]|jgi:DHA2 family multidrug resistance protein|nr:DHA2 family efflux MFS transporter permease subunit [Sphingomonadaceae bacterium]